MNTLIQNTVRLDRKNTGHVTYHQFANFIIKKYCGEICLQNMHRNGQITHASDKKINVQQFVQLFQKFISFIDAQSDQNTRDYRQLSQIFQQIDTDKDSLISYVQYFQLIDRYLCMNTQQFSQTFSKNEEIDQYSKISKNHNSNMFLSSPLFCQTKYNSSKSNSITQKLHQSNKQKYIYQMQPNIIINDHKNSYIDNLAIQSHQTEQQKYQQPINMQIQQSVKIYNYPQVQGVQFVSSIKDTGIDMIRKALKNDDNNKQSILESRESHKNLSISYSADSQISRNSQPHINILKPQIQQYQKPHQPISRISLIQNLLQNKKQTSEISINTSNRNNIIQSNTSNNSIKSIKSSVNKFKDSLCRYVKFDIYQKISQSNIPQSEWDLIISIWKQILVQYQMCSSSALISSQKSFQKIDEYQDQGIDRRGAQNILRIISSPQLLNTSQRQQQILKLLFPYSVKQSSYRISFLQLVQYI